MPTFLGTVATVDLRWNLKLKENSIAGSKGKIKAQKKWSLDAALDVPEEAEVTNPGATADIQADKAGTDNLAGQEKE